MMRYLVALLALSLPSLTPQTVPALPCTSVADYSNLPDGMNFGDVTGVAVNSKGHVFVFSRSNRLLVRSLEPRRLGYSSSIQEGNFVREIA